MAYWQKHGFNPDVRFDISVKNKTPVFESHRTRRDQEDWALLGMLAAKAEYQKICWATLPLARLGSD